MFAWSSVLAAALVVDIRKQPNQRIAQSLEKKMWRGSVSSAITRRSTWRCRGAKGNSTYTHAPRTGGCCCGGVARVTCCLLFSQGMLTLRRRLLQVHEYFRRHATVLNAALAFVHALSQKGFFPASVKYYGWRSIFRRAPLSATQNVHEWPPPHREWGAYLKCARSPALSGNVYLRIKYLVCV